MLLPRYPRVPLNIRFEGWEGGKSPLQGLLHPLQDIEISRFATLLYLDVNHSPCLAVARNHLTDYRNPELN